MDIELHKSLNSAQIGAHMSRDSLKMLLIQKPSQFWALVNSEGLSETMRQIIDEVSENELDGSGIERSEAMDIQGFA